MASIGNFVVTVCRSLKRNAVLSKCDPFFALMVSFEWFYSRYSEWSGGIVLKPRSISFFIKSFAKIVPFLFFFLLCLSPTYACVLLFFSVMQGKMPRPRPRLRLLRGLPKSVTRKPVSEGAHARPAPVCATAQIVAERNAAYHDHHVAPVMAGL